MFIIKTVPETTHASANRGNVIHKSIKWEAKDKISRFYSSISLLLVFSFIRYTCIDYFSCSKFCAGNNRYDFLFNGAYNLWGYKRLDNKAISIDFFPLLQMRTKVSECSRCPLTFYLIWHVFSLLPHFCLCSILFSKNGL